MRYVLLLFILFPYISWTQQKFDTIYVAFYVSNPPRSEYICDTGVCEGYCESYRSDGSLHIKGTFMEGQPVDTVYTYYSNGVIEERFITNKKGWHMLSYYQNGQLKSDYNVAKRSETEYYENGVLKKEYSWDKKYQNVTHEYTEGGDLIFSEDKHSQVKYDEKGNVLEEIHRKEVLVLNRLFSRDKSRFYEYTWDSFDPSGSKVRRIVFTGSGFKGGDYPNDPEEIPKYLFRSISFYENGEEYVKIRFETRKEGSEYVEYFIMEKLIDGEWVKERESLAEFVYGVIERSPIRIVKEQLK